MKPSGMSYSPSMVTSVPPAAGSKRPRNVAFPLPVPFTSNDRGRSAAVTRMWFSILRPANVEAVVQPRPTAPGVPVMSFTSLAGTIHSWNLSGFVKRSNTCSGVASTWIVNVLLM